MQITLIKTKNIFKQTVIDFLPKPKYVKKNYKNKKQTNEIA